jgi:hypothetical protein
MSWPALLFAPASFLTSAFLASCASADKSAATVRLLQDMRLEVLRLAADWGDGESVDGAALLRCDAWNNPIVIVQDPNDRHQWCLISAGPDGLWTTDGVLAAPEDVERKYRVDRRVFCEYAPHYSDDIQSDGRSFQVVGDDIVVHASGEVARPYPHVVPDAQSVAQAIAAAIRGGTPLALPLASNTREELERLSADDRALAAREIESRAANGRWCEDSWSHECHRKDGFLPRLYLAWEHEPVTFPPLRVDPEPDGWTAGADFEALLSIADPSRERRHEREAVPIHQILGHEILADGIFLCLEVTPSLRADPRWNDAADAVRTAISSLPEGTELGLVLYDEDGVEFFPASGRPAQANETMRLAAQEFATAFERGERRPKAVVPATEDNRLLAALVKSLRYANLSSARKRAIFYVGAAGVVAGRAALRDLNQALVLFQAQNFHRVPTFISSIGVELGSEREQLLKALTQGTDGGGYLAR